MSEYTKHGIVKCPYCNEEIQVSYDELEGFGVNEISHSSEDVENIIASVWKTLVPRYCCTDKISETLGIAKGGVICGDQQ